MTSVKSGSYPHHTCVYAKPDDADGTHNSLGSICQHDFHVGSRFRGVNNDKMAAPYCVCLCVYVCVCVCTCVYVCVCVCVCVVGDITCREEFITIRVCNSHMVSIPAIWIG